jgi:hypothetical protein
MLRHSLDRYGNFAAAKLGVLFSFEHPPITIFVGPKERSYRESSKERVQSQSVSRQGRDRENDIEIPKDQTIFVRGDVADTSATFKVKIVVISERDKEAVVAVLEPAGEKCSLCKFIPRCRHPSGFRACRARLRSTRNYGLPSVRCSQ